MMAIKNDTETVVLAGICIFARFFLMLFTKKSSLMFK